MSKSILQFVAGRREAVANAKTPVTNDQQAVSRAEFAQLTALVNTMAQAIEGLIEDFDTVNSPEKLKTTVNAAFKEVAPALNAAKRKTSAGSFLLPSDDDDGAVWHRQTPSLQANSTPAARKQAASRAGNYALPEGD